ncbi:MAG: tetratricopeptide repeat protein [Planctomycetota bacterium]|nr:MAG: tetratricopeptide repeat protein [Planctomycetota bacterium]
MPSTRTATWLLPALLAVLVFLPALAGGFVHDDAVLIRDNPNLVGWQAVTRGFGEPFWNIADDPRTHVGGFYRPLGIAAFALLRALGGGSPLPFHLASVLLHAVATVLVARIGLRLGWPPLAAGLAGAAFALHGMHAEAVAWASSLTYPLAAVCALSGLLALLGGRSWSAALGLGLGMISQETAIGLWLLALGWQLFRGDDVRTARWRGLGPLLLAGAVVWGLRAQAFGDWRAGFAGRPITFLGIPALELWAISFAVQAQALRYLVWPWPHAPFRPLPSPERVGLADPERWLPALCGAAVLLIAAGLWLLAARRWRRRGGPPPPLLLPAGLLFAALAPLLATANLGQFPFEERFLYLPSAGVCLIAGWLLGRRPAAAVLGLAWLAGHTASVLLVLPHWRNDRSFFDWGVEVSPHAMLPFTERGRLLLEEAALHPPGSPERVRLAEEAEKDFTAGLAIRPDQWLVTSVDRLQGNLGLATALYYQGLLDLAIDSYRKILGRWPDSFQARHGLGICLAEQGTRALEEGREEDGRRLLEEALAEQLGALEGAPDWAAAHHACGLILLRLDRGDEALPHLERAVQLAPQEQEYVFDLAQARWDAGRAEDFRRLIDDALARERDPRRRAEIHFRAGALELERAGELLEQGDDQQARALAEAAAASFRAAREADPGRTDALQGEASAEELLGRKERALDLAARAFAARPEDFVMAQTLFGIQYSLGRVAEARGTLEAWLKVAAEDHPARPVVLQTLRELDQGGEAPR